MVMDMDIKSESQVPVSLFTKKKLKCSCAFALFFWSRAIIKYSLFFYGVSLSTVQSYTLLYVGDWLEWIRTYAFTTCTVTCWPIIAIERKEKKKDATVLWRCISQRRRKKNIVADACRGRITHSKRFGFFLHCIARGRICCDLDERL